MGTLPLTAGTMGRGSGKKEKNLNELKQELEIDVHKVSVDELCKRFNSNVAEGLNDDQVAKGIKEHGLNQLTPPPTTPARTSPALPLTSRPLAGKPRSVWQCCATGRSSRGGRTR